MQTDRTKWDAKYRAAPQAGAPAAIVTRFAPWARRDRALDIAAGNGRHARLLADLGFRVDALDISAVGLGLIADPRVNRICIDLETFEIAPATYDLIVNVNFLLRRLFKRIIEGLRPGGIVIFETFLEGQPHPEGKAHRREYLLRENELLRAFLPLKIIYYQEWWAGMQENEDTEDTRVAGLVGLKQ